MRLRPTKAAVSEAAVAERLAPVLQVTPVWGPPPARVARRRGRLIAVTVLILVAAGGGVWGLKSLPAAKPVRDRQLHTVTLRNLPIVLQEKGELKAAKSVDIKSEIEGSSTVVSLIEEGKRAKKGDLLVELACEQINDKLREAEIKVASSKATYEAAVQEDLILTDENASKIRKAELALATAKVALEQYEMGDAVQFREDARLSREQAEHERSRTSGFLADSKELYAQGFITKIEHQAAEFDAHKAEIELKKARIKADVLEIYTIPMNLQEKRSAGVEAEKDLARVKKASASSEAKSAADVQGKKTELALQEDKLARLRQQKAKEKILAPGDGMVVYHREGWWDRDTIKVGSKVSEGRTLIELPDTRSMKLVVRVHEAKTQMLKLDLPATVELEGFAGRRFTGKVSRIAALADSSDRWLNPNLKEYETDILLDGEFTELKPGITGKAELQVKQLSNVVAVPVQSVYGQRGKFYVFLETGGKVRPVEVEPGLSSNEYVEIKKGLEAGQAIRLVVTDDLLLLLPDGGDGKAKSRATGEVRDEADESSQGPD